LLKESKNSNKNYVGVAVLDAADSNLSPTEVDSGKTGNKKVSSKLSAYYQILSKSSAAIVFDRLFERVADKDASYVGWNEKSNCP